MKKSDLRLKSLSNAEVILLIPEVIWEENGNWKSGRKLDDAWASVSSCLLQVGGSGFKNGSESILFKLKEWGFIGGRRLGWWAFSECSGTVGNGGGCGGCGNPSG